MATPITERAPRQGKEQTPLRGLMAQIAADVSLGVMATPYVPRGLIVGDIAENITESVESIQGNFSPGGECYEVMKVLKGDDFTKQPLKAQLDMVTEIDALPTEIKDSMATNCLDNLYRTYQATNPENQFASQKAWGDFVNVYKLFGCFRIRERYHVNYFPFEMYDPQTNIYLPSIVGNKSDFNPHEQGKVLTLANTELQTQIARATGILGKDETWVDFIHRPTIKIVEHFHSKQQGDEGLIIGELSSEPSALGGIPAYYRGILTKYTGTETEGFVAFDYHYDSSGEYRRKLDDQIAYGDISPRLVIKVPTQLILNTDPKTQV